MSANGGVGWRGGHPHLGVSDSGSTDTDGDSYQGWSDQGGWRDPSGPAYPRSSSSDEITRPQFQPLGESSNITRSVSFNPSGLGIPQRRQTITRPGVHSTGSNLSLDTVVASSSTGQSPILNMGEVTSPTTITPTPSISYPQPPAYTEASSSAYGTHSRAHPRRKSLSHVAPAPVESTESEENDGAYHANNGGVYKAKGKKRGRAGSFTYLPTHRRRRLSNAAWTGLWRTWSSAITKKAKSRFWGTILTLVGIMFLLLQWWKLNYELQIELAVFSHKWVRQEVDSIQPLKGCFQPSLLSTAYNLTRHKSPKRHLLSPGMSLQRGMSCYDFASTVQALPDEPLEHVTYHTYWRSDLIRFGERQSAALSAFLATQPLSHSKLILWTNGADSVSSNEHVKPYLERWGAYIEVRQVDILSLSRGTEIGGLLSGGAGGGLFDERAWVDGDAVRLLVLWHYGGVWVDMDMILTRDLHPLTEQEFVTQWDCYDKPYFSLNGALMHFQPHSPYLCEAFHIMASSPLPKPNTFTWGSHLYAKLHRRLVSAHVKPFSVLPWCFSDPRNCRSDIRFPDPFAADPKHFAGRRWDGRGEVGKSGREIFEEKVGYVWGVHLHNQWKKGFPPGGWVRRLLDGYKVRLEEIERFGLPGSGIGPGGVGAGAIRVKRAMVGDRVEEDEDEDGAEDKEDEVSGQVEISVGR